MRKTGSMVAGVALALALAGCHKNESTGAAASNAADATGSAVGNGADATGSAIANAADSVKDAVTATPTGQEFADKAAKSDAFEIESAKLAKTNASSADVKSFASMMITDHTMSTAEVKKAAGDANPKIMPDKTLTQDQQDKLTKLKGLKGADFDKEYADQQVDAHQDALTLMRQYAKDGTVVPLKTAAGEIEPKVATHLDKIKAIKDKM